VLEFGRYLRCKLEREGKNNIGVSIVLPGFVSTNMANTTVEQMSKIGPVASMANQLMMSAEKAASIIVSGVEQNLEIVAFPYWQFAVLRVINFLPFALQQAIYGQIPAQKSSGAKSEELSQHPKTASSAAPVASIAPEITRAKGMHADPIDEDAEVVISEQKTEIEVSVLAHDAQKAKIDLADQSKAQVPTADRINEEVQQQGVRGDSPNLIQSLYMKLLIT
jgi:hypothetical protein